jgi:hypothetical protein
VHTNGVWERFEYYMLVSGNTLSVLYWCVQTLCMRFIGVWKFLCGNALCAHNFCVGECFVCTLLVSVGML